MVRVSQCHKPPMTVNGEHTNYRKGDFPGGWFLTLLRPHKIYHVIPRSSILMGFSLVNQPFWSQPKARSVEDVRRQRSIASGMQTRSLSSLGAQKKSLRKRWIQKGLREKSTYVCIYSYVCMNICLYVYMFVWIYVFTCINISYIYIYNDIHKRNTHWWILLGI